MGVIVDGTAERRTCTGLKEGDEAALLSLFLPLSTKSNQRPQTSAHTNPPSHPRRPGGHLSPTDPELPTLQHILTTNLSPTNPNPKPPPFTWPIHSTLTTWTRPHFSTTMYPYTPPHITRPKEIKKLYLVPLPARAELAVPKNMKLLAVPLHELYDNSARYGALLSAIPHYLSAVRWEFVDEEGEVCGGSAGGGGWEREEGEKGEGQAAVVVERKRRKEVEGEEDATEDEVKADDIKGEEKLQRDDYVLVDAQIQAQAHPRSGEEEEAEEEQTTNGSAAESNFRMEEDIG